MRDLAIAYGNSRQAKKWVNKTIRYADLKERLKVTIRTAESAEEYAKMSKAQRDAAKDHGGFVGGVLKGGRRKVDAVELRSMIALDGDRIDKAFLDAYETNAPYTSCLYTTHSSTEANPRVRLVFPLLRDVTSEEFVAVSRYLAQMLGIDFFDECSYQPNQLMYWPSSPQNGVFVFKEVEKEWLDPDAILSAHPEWTDPTRLPTSSRESKANQVTQQKVQDPLEKEGTVGIFNRVFFPVTRALETFLAGVYEPTESESKAELDRFIAALKQIKQEVLKVERGEWPKEDNPLVNAPHTASDVTGEWAHPYSREEAVFPLPFVREHKFWPSVKRVDEVYGDRNLVCSCLPIDAYED